jgi:hypothetical protein
MPNLIELQKEVEQLEQLAEANQQTPVTEAVPQAPDPILDIADHDPDLKRYLVEPDSELARLFPKFVSTNLAGAKRLLAHARGIGTLLDTVRDETLHITVRVAAAAQWRAQRPAGNQWEGLSDADLVESLCVHPHAARLKELSAFICNPEVPPKVGYKQYLQDQWDAIQEFDKLRNEFPLRDVAAVAIRLEYVAARFIKNAPPEISQDFTARQVIYDYAKELSTGKGVTQ